MIKNLTYRNLMIIVHKLEKKGYTFEEAVPLARNIFAEFNPNGLSIGRMTEMVLTKSEFENEKTEDLFSRTY